MKQQFQDLPDIVRRIAFTGSEHAYREMFDLLYLPVKKFAFCMYSNTDLHKLTFLYSGRLLWDKGIGELIEAYRYQGH